jgi:hypothetical protein
MAVAVRIKVVVLCLVMLLAGAGLTAWAQTSSGPPTHTGCLNTATGTIVKVKRGHSPLSACGGGQTTIKLSAGDITEIITASDSGLTGGAKGGIVTLALDYSALDARYAAGSPATRACVGAELVENANLSYCYLQRTMAEGVTLIGANLRFADLTGADLSNAVLSNANLTRADLRYADLRTVFMPNANLTRANLFGSLLEGANIAGVTWQNTICPDGTVSNANGGTCDGHLSPTTP